MEPKAVASGIPVYCSHTDIVPLSDLRPNPVNPNKHPKAQVELLGKAIKSNGWRNPVVVSNQSGLVVKGHGRMMAAELIGATEIPVDRQDYESIAHEHADLLADNKIPELAEMDNDALKDLLQDLDTGALDMDLTGFDSESIEKMMVPTTVLDEAWTQKGTMYRLGRHRLLCGDIKDLPSVERILDGETVPIYIGAGSTIMGAESAGRTCFGLTREPSDCDAIVRVWAEHNKLDPEEIFSAGESPPE